MRKGMRFGFTAAEKAEVWDRWRRGESLHEIGRAFGKLSSSVYCQLAHTGGIRPRPRRRSRLALSLSEREEISRGIAAEGFWCRQPKGIGDNGIWRIAKRNGCDSVSRRRRRRRYGIGGGEGNLFRASVWQAVIVCILSAYRRHSSSTTTTVEVGFEPVGT